MEKNGVGDLERKSSTSRTRIQPSSQIPTNGSSKKLLSIKELPDWYQRNIYILSSYRPASYSYRESLWDIFRLHNETANIYSHLIPAVITVLGQLVLWQCFWPAFPNATYRDYSIFAFQIFTATTCFTLSAVYHSMLNHSGYGTDLWTRIDYCGILFLILGEFVSGIYVSFYCEPRLQKTYWAMIVTVGALTAKLVLDSAYQDIRFRLLRLAAFVTTALTGLAPVMHGILTFESDRVWNSGMQWYFLEGGLLLTGVFFYAMHVPERFAPGKFDMCFYSHFLFHCCVVLASVSHFYGTWSAFAWMQAAGRCLVPLRQHLADSL